MRYNTTLLKICKPLYKTGVLIFWCGATALVIGIVLRLLSKGWLFTLIGLGCCAGGILIYNIPTYYLARGFIQEYYQSITAKQSVNIAQKHLREPIDDNRDTINFVQNIIDGFEQEKTKHKYKGF